MKIIPIIDESHLEMARLALHHVGVIIARSEELVIFVEAVEKVAETSVKDFEVALHDTLICIGKPNLITVDINEMTYAMGKLADYCPAKKKQGWKREYKFHK